MVNLGFILKIEKEIRTALGSTIELDLVFSDEIGNKILFDEIQLKEIFMNIVSNAKNAMPAGGKLKIETKSKQLTDVRSSEHTIPAGSYALILISDNGARMDPETQKHIFEPFYSSKPFVSAQRENVMLFAEGKCHPLHDFTSILECLPYNTKKIKCVKGFFCLLIT